jgi:hypothetical protein
MHRFLAEEEGRGEEIAAALAVVGSLTPEDAETLRERTRALRERWR